MECVLFGGEEFDEVRIESSPYLRTMQTASHFMRGFSHSYHLTVNHLYGEALDLKEDAQPHLYLKNLPAEEFKQLLAGGVSWTDDHKKYEEYMSKRFPEKKKDLKERVEQFNKEILQVHTTSGKRTLHLIFGHGCPTRMMSSMNGGAKNKCIPFNGFSAYIVADEKITMMIDRKHCKQLKNLKKELVPFSKISEKVIDEVENDDL